MLKKVLVIFVILMIAMQGLAFAASGEIVLEDVAYGGAIGGLLGGAWYLLDQDEAGKKIGMGIGIGIIAGFLLGITDVQSMVEVEDGEMTVGLPSININYAEASGTTYSASLMNYHF